MPMLSYQSFVAVAAGLGVLATLAPSVAAAQTPPPPKPSPMSTGPHLSPVAPLPAPMPSSAIPGADIVHFETKIGSFKVLGSDKVPVQGKMEINFDGTVLVSGLEKGGAVTTSGSIKLEKETADHVRQVYFGKGKMTVMGRMRSFQFFGKDMDGTFQGLGIFRLFGEFDKKLETGYIWYQGDEKRPWGTGGNQMVVPNPMAVAPNGRVRVHPAGS